MSKVVTALSELRDQPDADLRLALVRTQDELFRLNLGQYTNQVTSSASLTTKRRDIARIKTILRGRELGIDKQAQKTATATATAAAPEAPAAKKAKKAKKS